MLERSRRLCQEVAKETCAGMERILRLKWNAALLRKSERAHTKIIENTIIQNNLERAIFKESNDETTVRATPDI